MLIDVVILLVVGALAGLSAGLLGIGGGLIVVPALALVFQGQGLADTSLMHEAVGTSLATIVLTSLSSIRAHHRRGAVDWGVVAGITPGILAGVVLGVLIATALSGAALRMILGVFLLIVAARMLLGARPPAGQRLPGVWVIRAAGVVIGAISSVLGIGGGTLSVPFLSRCGVDMRRAVATAATIGLPIALAGTVGFVISGWSAPDRPPWSLGYVYLPGLIGIVATSVLFAPLGARLAHTLPIPLLKRVFAVFLILVGLKLLLDL